MTERQRFYGKYRGTVVDINDLHKLGRIRAIVPGVTGEIPCSWALPCVPFAGTQLGYYTTPGGNRFFQIGRAHV